MWNRAFLRLLSLSFTAFFVVALLWRESRPRGAAAPRKRTQAAPGNTPSDPASPEGENR